MLNLFRYVGIRSVFSRPIRTTLTTASVTCGVALWIAISIINEATLDFFKESFSAVFGRATLTVSGGEAGFEEGVAERLEKVRGVVHAVPVIESRAWLTSTNESVVVLGVDLLQEKSVRSYRASGRKIIGDSLTFITQPDSLIVTETFAKDHALKEGDALELSTVKGNVRFTVRGVLSPSGLAKAYGGGMAIMDIDAAREAFQKKGKVDRVDIVTADLADVNHVAERIRAAVGPALAVERPELQTEQMERMVKSFQVMLRFFSTLALIVGVFLIANSVSISVAERRKEIGSLRALGSTKTSILAMFMGEAVVMGLVGAFGGAFLGRAMAAFMVSSVHRALKEQEHQVVTASTLSLTTEHVFTALLIGFVAALAAAAWPAFKATRVQPIEAMRGRESEDALQRFGVERFGGPLGLALLVYSVGGSFLLGEINSRFLEVTSQLGAIVGAALVGPPIVRVLTGWLGKYFGKSEGGLVQRLAMENLLRNPRRTASNVMTLMVGLIMVIMIAAINKSFKGTISGWYDRVLQADLLVSSTGKLASYNSQALNEELGDRIRAMDGVAGTYGVRYIHISYEGQKVSLKAYDDVPLDKKGLALYDVQDRDVEEAVKEFYGAPDPVAMVSKSFVLRFKKGTGDSIELQTPGGPRKFRIVATMLDFMSPIGVIYLPRRVYREMFNDRLMSAYGIALKPGEDPLAVRKRIDTTLGRERMLTVVSNADIRKDVDKTVDESFAYTRTVEASALLVALFGLLNTLLVSVMERTRELGMMRAIGMSRKQLTKMILLEAMGQGGMGALASVALGSGLAALWVNKSLANILGWILDFHFPWVGVLLTFLMGIVVAILAAWYPARRATRIPIVEAIEYE